jgi:hypothetical protein
MVFAALFIGGLHAINVERVRTMNHLVIAVAGTGWPSATMVFAVVFTVIVASGATAAALRLALAPSLAPEELKWLPL